MTGERAVSILGGDWILSARSWASMAEGGREAVFNEVARPSSAPRCVFFWPLPPYNFCRIRSPRLNLGRVHIKMQTSGFCGKMENDNASLFPSGNRGSGCCGGWTPVRGALHRALPAPASAPQVPTAVRCPVPSTCCRWFTDATAQENPLGAFKFPRCPGLFSNQLNQKLWRQSV